MKVQIKTADVDDPLFCVMEFEVDATDPVMALKCLIESAKPHLGTADSQRLVFRGEVITSNDATLESLGYAAGSDMLLVLKPNEEMGSDELQKKFAKGIIKPVGGLPLSGRDGSPPTAGFGAVQVVVSGCMNEKTNGVFLPAQPFNGKPVWYKAALESSAGGYEAGDVEMDGKGKEQGSKDNGERGIFYSEKGSRWYIGDSLFDNGFTFATAFGQSEVPPLKGWQNGSVEFAQVAAVADGDLDAAAALTEVGKLSEVEWEAQEVCYVTMLKVLGNIAANPGESKFCSIKIENPAIQAKILKHNGARGLLEAVGFRENAGALVLPTDRSDQAKMAQQFLQGYATEAKYYQVRKERHAKAAEETKKEAAKPKPRVMGKDANR